MTTAARLANTAAPSTVILNFFIYVLLEFERSAWYAGKVGSDHPQPSGG
jgi:hypothetical protein